MTIDLVIFDCDGVLVDSEPIVTRILVDMLAEEGLAMSFDEADCAFLGLSWESTFVIIEARLGHALSHGFLDRIQARCFAAFHDELKPIPGVKEAVAKIPYPCCVASSGESARIRLALGLTGLLGYFDGRLFSAEEVSRGKPFPDLFLHAAAQMGASPGACIVIEDSLAGVTGARAAGMRVFAYVPPVHEERGWTEQFRKAGAEKFADMVDLPELLC